MAVRTLYKVTGVPPTLDGIFDALPLDLVEHPRAVVAIPTVYPEGVAALLINIQDTPSRVNWADDLEHLVGEPLDLHKQNALAILMLAIDDQVYSIGFGQGFRHVPEEIKDPTFGLRIAVRSIDPDDVREAFRKSMHGTGRMDATTAYSGIPIASIGIRQHRELVRKLAGMLTPGDFGLSGKSRIKIEGSAGLRLPLPSDPAELVALIRSLAKISTAAPQPGLAFIEAIQPVSDNKLKGDLDAELDGILRRQVDAPLSLAMPISLCGDEQHASSYTIRIGSGVQRDRLDVSLDAVLQRVAVLNRKSPAEALRNGRIEMYDASGDRLGSTSAIKWIETCVVRGSSHYFLLEGQWYEGGADYLAAVRRQIEELLTPTPSITFPAWRKGEIERDYCLRAQQVLGRARFLTLDRALVRTALHKDRGFEVCDGYGEHGELIVIKPADRAAPLSHQFNQALIAVESLLHDPDARKGFNALVTEASGGTRHVLPGAIPQKVIFGIHLKTGRDLTPDTLFPFAQLALINMVATLRQDVEVEVIGIPAE